jgi:hypothetical protein
MAVCRFEHRALLHSLLPRAAISKLKADLDLASGDSVAGRMFEQGKGYVGYQQWHGAVIHTTC